MSQPASAEQPAPIATPKPIQGRRTTAVTPARLCAAVFWIYTALCILWLLIGLLPAVLAAGNLTYRQMLDATADAPGLRHAWISLYLASMRAEPPPALFMQYAFSALNIALGIVLYRSRPWDWVARLLALGLVGTAAIFNYQAHSTLELIGPFVNAVHEFLHVFSGSMYLIALLIFPDGKLPPWPVQRWRPPPAAGRIVGPLAILGLLLFGYGLTLVLHGEPASFVAFYGIVVPAVGISAQAFRYRAADGHERQLSKTLMLALLLSLAAALALGVGAWLVQTEPLALPWRAQDALNRLAFIVFPLLFALLPLSLTAIVLRYRLWEIDLVINRSLVYGGLTAVVVLLYGLAVGGLGLMLGAQSGVAVAVAATVLVAMLFQPLRAWLQRGVNRLMYGERDDPIAVLTRLGRQLEAAVTPDALLPAVVETVAQALRLPYVAIVAGEEGQSKVLAQYPAQPWPESVAWREGLSPQVGSSLAPAAVASFSLTSQGLPVGRLVVAPRAPGQSFSLADRRLLTSVAQQAGAAVETVRLAADLQHARERLVLAREEERRRLRRDLHDGLGPQLATLTLQLDAARNLLDSNPQQAGQVLAEIKAQTQAAIADIRRLVYELRPPVLDQLGLVSALHEQAARAASDNLTVQVMAPDDLPPLPAAVEVAAYRIVAEALTNVVRHSQARRGVVWLCPDDALYVAVDDDGIGLPDQLRSGVGLASMRERAEELGGALRVERRPEGGTRVMARLPLTV